MTRGEDLTEMVTGAAYTPALSHGYATFVMRKANEVRSMPNGFEPKDLDFLDPNSGLFHLPVALYSAGVVPDLTQDYVSMVTTRDRNNAIVIGDSSGFQIKTGKKEIHDDTDRTKIIAWLARTCDFAMTLDVPGASVFDERNDYQSFGQCLNATLEHLEFFHRMKQECGIELLNVLHGNNDQEADIWLDAVKKYQFSGWAFAGPTKTDLYSIVRRLLKLHREGRLDHKTPIHFLGKSTLEYAAILTVLARAFAKFVNNENVIFTFDTSSPLVSAGKYATIYLNGNFGGSAWSMSSVSLDIGNPNHIGSSQPFPGKTSPLGRMLTLGDVVVKDTNHVADRRDSLAITMMCNHNVYVLAKAIIEAKKHITRPRHEAMIYCPGRLLDLKDAIEDVFSARHPEEMAEARKEILRLRVA